MKRLVIAIALAMALLLCGCGESRTEVSREPVDVRYTALRETIETRHVHKYSWVRGEFVLVPEIYTEMHPEMHEVLYRITYDDGFTRELWLEVGISTYNDCAAELEAQP